jgi:hypothetical protein
MKSAGRSLVSLLALLLATPAAADPIADLVAQVSEADLQAHVEALAAAPRSTPAQQSAAAAYITATLESYGYTVVHDPVGTSENLIATLAGTGTPERAFLVGAHFDSVPGSPGADDNASGVAGMLEAARVFAGQETASSIEFVAFAHEESGLVGSTQYASAIETAGRELVGMLSLEMIGHTCAAPCQVVLPDFLPCLDVSDPVPNVGNFIAAIANQASATLLSNFTAAATSYVSSLPVETAEVQGVGSCLPDSRRSDHAPFWDRGYRAAIVTDTANFRNVHYHQSTDTPATIDYAFAARVTRAVVAMVANEVTLAPRLDVRRIAGNTAAQKLTFKATLSSDRELEPASETLALTLRDGATVVYAATLPAGLLTPNAAGTRFKLVDPTGANGGIVKALLSSGDGVIWQVLVKSKGPATALPAWIDRSALVAGLAASGDEWTATVACRARPTGSFLCRP